MVKRVGFIGLGKIGRPLAANLVTAGFDVMVYDVREEPLLELERLGAAIGRSPKEVGAHSEVIGISVVTDAQVQEVVLGKDGIIYGAAPGTIVAIHSTVHYRTVCTIAEQVDTSAVHVIDAQVSGGSKGAEARTLCYMVGGDTALFERCRPVFAASGKNIFHVGALGMAAITKLAQQVINCGTILAVSEGVKLAERAGLDSETFLKVVSVSAGQSYVADHWLTSYRDFDDRLAENLYTGLEPALKLGHELNLMLPGTALAQQSITSILGTSRQKP